MALDWISNLFQSEQTRGLSGDAAGSVALDDSNPYYNYRLRRHKAEGDLVATPELLWYTSASVKRRGGLGVHIASEKGEGVATYTDVLLILSQEDYARATEDMDDPWLARAVRSMLGEFEEFCTREGFRRRYAHRQLGFKILADGSPEMGGQALGLGAGDFVTGLLPNLYSGPVKGSYPVIGVHVNLPGAWDGYKEIGRLYNDQILFTLGSHWLDNFPHAGLREAALYRLQQYPDGSFVHIINPDLQDRYQVTSTDQGGASVLTIATRDGQPLAYMVLAVIDPPEDAAKPGIAMPAMGGAGGRDSIPPPMLIDDQVQPVPAQGAQGKLGGKTIIPDAPSERIFTLQERGALLQRVHFGNFMEGYDVFLGTRGELGTVVEDKAATFQVRRKRVSLLPHIDGIQVGGYPVAAGVEVPIEGDLTIQVGGQRLEYRDLRSLTVDGWPYVGEIRRPASSNYMAWGGEYRVGRSRDCRVVLPDEPRNENIHWKPSVGDGATIRSRSGEIPKSRFYTDSIMVASEHCGVDLRGDEPGVVCHARACYVYVRRGPEIVVLYPTQDPEGRPTETTLLPGDEILAGNCLFQVGYTPREQAVAPAPAPKIELSSGSLADAVSSPDFDRLDAPSDPGDGPQPLADAPPPPPSKRKKGADRPAPDDAPAARGLGQDGVAPTPPEMPRVGVDSILGAAPIFDDEVLPPPTNPRRGDTPPPAPNLDVADAPPPPPGRRPAAPPPPPPSAQDKTVQLYDDDEFEGMGLPVAVPPPVVTPVESERTPPPPMDRVDMMDPAADDETADAPPPPPRGKPNASLLYFDDEDATEPPPPPPSVRRSPEPPPMRAEPPPPPAGPPPPTSMAGPPPPPAAPMAAAPPPPAPEPLDDIPAEPTLEIDTPPPASTPPLAVAPPPPPPPSAEAETVEVSFPSPAAKADKPQTAPPEAGQLGEIVAVDDAEAQFELGRRMQLVHVGWTINGQVTCGNHSAADLVVPENRVVEGQIFTPMDYFELKVRGRRGTLQVRSPRELLIDGDDPSKDVYDEPEKVTIDVIRRDDAGEEDFAVRLQLVEDKALPDPRARLLEIDCGDPLAAALFTRGLPTRQPRTLDLAGIEVTLLYDGEGVVVSDYLASYRDGDGFKPFFIQHGGERFQTAPEDGSDIRLVPSDRLVVGNAVYVLREG